MAETNNAEGSRELNLDDRIQRLNADLRRLQRQSGDFTEFSSSLAKLELETQSISQAAAQKGAANVDAGMKKSIAMIRAVRTETENNPPYYYLERDNEIRRKLTKIRSNNEKSLQDVGDDDWLK